jgi:hypothetical protein
MNIAILCSITYNTTVLDPHYKHRFFVDAPQDQIFESQWVEGCHKEFLTIFLAEYATPAIGPQSPVKYSNPERSSPLVILQCLPLVNRMLL